MFQIRAFRLTLYLIFQFGLGLCLLSSIFAEDWKYRNKPKGTLKVVDLRTSSHSIIMNYAEGLVTTDVNNRLVPCLAEDLRWIDDRSIEFKLREGVKFQNGERFNAESVRINWEAYRQMASPTPFPFDQLKDEADFRIIDDYTVRFSFAQPDGLALVKFDDFWQLAPAFFEKNSFEEGSYGFLPKPGPWGTGPFELLEGGISYGKASDQVVLAAFKGYWDRRYPRVEKLIFDNSLIGDREEAMLRCQEQEGKVDIISYIRPLDTLKIAGSKYAKVVKSKDVASLAAFINQRKKGSKWRDARLRLALNHAINRVELQKYAAKGNAYNLSGFIPPGESGHSTELDIFRYDTEKAKRLLSEAGFSNGFDIKIITSEVWKLEAQLIAKMFERVGLKPNLNILKYPVYLWSVVVPPGGSPSEQQDWDIAIGNYSDFYGHIGLSFFAFGFTEKSGMRWIAADPIYERKWDSFSKTVDTETQELQLRQMLHYLYEKAYLLFIYSPLTLYAVNKEVAFVPHKDTFLNLKETSVTDHHWSVRGENN